MPTIGHRIQLDAVSDATVFERDADTNAGQEKSAPVEARLLCHLIRGDFFRAAASQIHLGRSPPVLMVSSRALGLSKLYGLVHGVSNHGAAPSFETRAHAKLECAESPC